MSTLTTGDKLTHTDSGVEAEYVTAIPTAGHGFLHLLKSAEGYIFRLTGDLEAEFSQEGKSTTLAQDQTPQSMEAELLAKMEAMLNRALAANATGNAPAPVAADPAPATDEPQGAQTSPLPLIPDASAHLDPAAENAGLAAQEPADEPKPVDPPPNSIPI